MQGFGNVGSVAAELLVKEGCKVVAISDRTGGYYNKNGIDIDAAIKHVQQARSLEGFTGGDQITNEELLTLDVDVLLPAALENVITSKNAGEDPREDHLRRRERSDDRRRRLDPRREGRLRHPGHSRECRRRDRLVLRVGAGSRRLLLDGRVVNERLTDIMCAQLRRRAASSSKQHKVNMRTAAYMLSISRVATVHRLRGIYA